MQYKQLFWLKKVGCTKIPALEQLFDPVALQVEQWFYGYKSYICLRYDKS